MSFHEILGPKIREEWRRHYADIEEIKMNEYYEQKIKSAAFWKGVFVGTVSCLVLAFIIALPWLL